MSSMTKIETRTLPVLALRGLNIFPGMLLNFDVERAMSIAALNYAMNKDQIIFLVTQKEIATDIPTKNDIFEVGTVCRVRQLIRQPGGKLCKVMVEGLYRGRLLTLDDSSDSFFGSIEHLEDKPERVSGDKNEALVRTVIGLFDEYVTLAGNMPPEMLLNVVVSSDASYVSNYIAHNVRFGYQEKQSLLEELRPTKRLEMLIKMLNHELNVMTIEQELSEATNEQVSQIGRAHV